MIPLLDSDARLQMLHKGLQSISHALSEADFSRVVADTDGYSGSDMAGLCREAAMEPLRDEGMREALLAGTSSEPRAITYADFESALAQVRPSVSASELKGFEEWNRQFGSFQNKEAKAAAARGGAA